MASIMGGHCYSGVGKSPESIVLFPFSVYESKCVLSVSIANSAAVTSGTVRIPRPIFLLLFCIFTKT